MTIPNSVTYIGENVFEKCDNLKDVTLNSNAILSKSYSSSSNLQNIFGPQVINYEIGNSVTSIGSYAFYGCDITTVTIGNSVKEIGYEAFGDCSYLKGVTINSNAIISTNYSSYFNLQNIFGSQVTNYTIGNSVTSIGSCAFYGCNGLTSVTIPNSVTEIGDEAFSSCSNLEQITVESENPNYDSRENCNAIIHTENNTLITGCKNTRIPNSVTSIGNYAFSGCSGLTSVTIPNSVKEIGNYAFEDCNGLTSATIPSSVTSIGYYAFSGCRDLKKVIVPDLTAWCRTSFYNFTSNPLYYARHLYNNENTEIINLIIPDGVTSIGDETFLNCSALTSVTIPNSVTSIGYYAFHGCNNLTSVISLIQEPDDIPTNAFGYSNDGIYYNATLYVPEGTEDKYRSRNGWKEFKNIVEGDPTSIVLPDNYTSETTETERYDINGKRIATPQRGINVVKMSDGTVKKVLVK